MVSTSSNLTRGIILIDNTNFMASAYTGGQGPSILTKENVNTLLTKVIESTTSGSRTVASIGDYTDNTSANSHANAYVYGLATCINQMLAEDCIRCHTSALDQFWLNLTTTRVHFPCPPRRALKICIVGIQQLGVKLLHKQGGMSGTGFVSEGRGRVAERVRELE
jgi:hypothetical protein